MNQSNLEAQVTQDQCLQPVPVDGPVHRWSEQPQKDADDVSGEGALPAAPREETALVLDPLDTLLFGTGYGVPDWRFYIEIQELQNRSIGLHFVDNPIAFRSQSESDQLRPFRGRGQFDNLP